ncbi:hypothetical protein OUZ56_007987 [Daphnia magna]|uniref:Uncharacterized protein n=1 Tax=Daphnia magna TaxID=35525 RepID=A0ABR0ABS8_9CRUS|nr:hypothetical protein OUZ56_007987 [Daphnia magna]
MMCNDRLAKKGFRRRVAELRDCVKHSVDLRSENEAIFLLLHFLMRICWHFQIKLCPFVEHFSPCAILIFSLEPIIIEMRWGAWKCKAETSAIISIRKASAEILVPMVLIPRSVKVGVTVG